MDLSGPRLRIYQKQNCLKKINHSQKIFARSLVTLLVGCVEAGQ
jgi:hypothetical protein